MGIYAHGVRLNEELRLSLYLSSFRKEEYPKGEVVGEICRVSDSYSYHQ